MFVFVFVLQTIVAVALVAIILMQRSEGGGLGIGGSPGGIMGARGAADFLTRATKWLAIVFVVLSIALAALAVEGLGGDALESDLDRSVTPAAPVDPLGGSVDPLGGSANPASSAPTAVPATPPTAAAPDPLAD